MVILSILSLLLLQAEVDKLEAALRSLQSRHSSVDVEFIAMNDSAMDQSREDAEFITGLHQVCM